MERLFRQIDNPLLQSFVSDENMDLLQNRIIEEVKRRTGLRISRQSDRDLLGIMNATYHERANMMCGLPTELEVRRLNDLVLEEAMPIVLNGMHSYMLYVRDASQMAMPIDRALSTTADKSLENKSFF
jgi:hypothetical protein